MNIKMSCYTVCQGIFKVCFVIQYFVSFLFCKYIDGEEKCSCFNLVVLLIYCDCPCSETLPHGAKGWSAVCDCGISCADPESLLEGVKLRRFCLFVYCFRGEIGSKTIPLYM